MLKPNKPYEKITKELEENSIPIKEYEVINNIFKLIELSRKKIELLQQMIIALVCRFNGDIAQITYRNKVYYIKKDQLKKLKCFNHFNDNRLGLNATIKYYTGPKDKDK